MTTATAAKLETETVVLIPLDQCHKSPSQPRRRNGDKLPDDFVASIREKGVLQPIVVRKRKAGGYEIVFGHCRHKGCDLAGRDVIPAIVRDMNDEEVFEAQLIENVHRNDLHPLDEADGFKRMIANGRTAQQIADKIGRTAPYVAQRLKLCEMGKEARAALDDGTITLGVAVVLARVPASLQGQALKGLEEWRHERTSAPAAKKALETTYLLRLDHAPFDIASPDLVPKAGACIACPKQTGMQRELFPDAARADLCTDPICFSGKVDALWNIRVAESKTGGPAVLEGKAGQKALSYGGGYKKLDEQEWIGGKTKTVRALLGKDLPPLTLARDERSGAIVELVRQADVDKVLRVARKQDPNDSGRGDGDWRAKQKREDAKKKLRQVAIDLAIGEAVARAGKIGPADMVRLLTFALVEANRGEGAQAILKRLGIAVAKSWQATEKLAAHLRTITKPADFASIGLELALRSDAPDHWSGGTAAFGATLKKLGVNFAAIEKKVAAEAKAKKGAKKAKKPAGKKSAAKKGA